MADARRIVHVQANLFDNAAQQSQEGAPIQVTAVRDGAEVAVSVTDGGEGIAPERLPHLFHRHAGAGRVGSSGVGLLICKGLVEALWSAVAKLRRKLVDDARKPCYVAGVRGLGYRIPEPEGP